MNKPTENRKSKSDIYREKAALHNSGLALILVLVIFGTTGVYAPNNTVSTGDVLSAIVGFMALLGLIWLDVVNYRRADELQQIIRLKAAAISFAAVIAISFAGEILINLNVGTARQYLQIIFIGGVILWVTTPMLLTHAKRK